MNFKSYIDRAYKELNLIPINGQEFAVDKVLTEFFINNKRNVILSADTGTGKSIIGAVIAKVFSYEFEDELSESDEVKNSMIVVHSNSLVKQYGQTFKDFDSKEFHQIIGAGNYKCEAGKTIQTTEKNKIYTGEDCFKKKAEKNIVEKYCNHCAYNIAKSYINKTDTLITNYSYHFISSMWSHHLKPRKIIIFDEAHTINDVFCEHNSIYVSAERLKTYIDECQHYYPLETREFVSVLNSIREDVLRDKVVESNYVLTIKRLMGAYKQISAIFKKKAEEAMIDDFLKLNKISKKYFDLGCKIGDLFTYEYDHVFENKEFEFTIKPIFVNKMSEQIMAEYNLFMSATISPEFMMTTMNLTETDTAFVKLAPVYDPENKQIMFCGTKKLNYSAMNDPETIKDLQDTVAEIVDSTVEDGYKGLMLTPSFDISEKLSKKIPKTVKLFLHKRGMKIDPLINEFKSYTGGPAILVSPSIYEGLDFADDYSRYQIIVKAPYPSLGEKRMKHIAEKYPEVYRIITLKKIVQGIGRSCRNSEDWCLTFVLDANIEQLFNSRLNVWKNQFKVL